jgi:hypothetical protein
MTEEEKIWNSILNRRDTMDESLLNEIYQRNNLEVFALLRRFGDDEKNKEGKELLDWKRQLYSELIELVRRQKRELDFQAGEKIAPETQFSAAEFQGKVEFGGA